MRDGSPNQEGNMNKLGRVKQKEHRFGELRVGSNDLGTQRINGRIQKPGVEYVLGRNEGHKALIEKPMLSVEKMVPMLLRSPKK